IVLDLVPDAVEDEDMMEMANAGLIDILIVDDWKAKIWAPVLPKLRVTDVMVRDDGEVGWAIRKGSPKLEAAIHDFDVNYSKKHGTHPYRLKLAASRVKEIQDPKRSGDWKRFEETLALFRRYGDRYHFDPLMLAAQGYQESGLNPAAKSHVGAVGVMQLMPA